MKYYAAYVDKVGDYTPNQKVDNPKPGHPGYKPRWFEAGSFEHARDIAVEWLSKNPFPFMKSPTAVIIFSDHLGSFRKFDLGE